MMDPQQGPQNGQPGPEQVFYQHTTLIQQVVTLDVDSDLRDLLYGDDAAIEEIVTEIHRIRRIMGYMLQVLLDAFAGVRGDAQNQHQDLRELRRQMALLQTRLNEVSNEVTRISRNAVDTLKEKYRRIENEAINMLRHIQNAQEETRRIPPNWSGISKMHVRELPYWSSRMFRNPSSRGKQ